MIGVYDEIIQLHLHKLGMTWKLIERVHHVLSDGSKLRRLDICLSLLLRKKASFLDKIVTCDGNWVYMIA